MNTNSVTSAKSRVICIKHCVMVIIIIIAILGLVGLVIVFIHIICGEHIISQGAVLCGYILVCVSILTPTVTGCVCLCSLIPFPCCCHGNMTFTQYNARESSFSIDIWNTRQAGNGDPEADYVEMNSLDVESRMHCNEMDCEDDMQVV